METKEIEIEFNGKLETVVIKRLTYGERAKYRKESRKIFWIGGVQKVEVDEERQAIAALKYGIKSAPFNHEDDNAIRNLPGNIGDMLFQEIDSFNSLDEKKSKSSETPSG